MDEPIVFTVRTADNTPPEFTANNPSVLRVTFTAANIRFELTEAGTVSFMVVDASLGITPTNEEIFSTSLQPRFQALPDASGTIVLERGFEAVPTTANGLTGLTDYTLWAIAVDSEGNEMTAPARLDFQTLDDQPPELDAGVLGTGPAQTTLEVRLDEPGRVFYRVTRSSNQDACPNSEALKAQVQATSGTSAGMIEAPNAGDRETRWVSCRPRPSMPNTALSVSCLLSHLSQAFRVLQGLSDETEYTVCVVAEDEFFNLQSSATALIFTTLDGTPPTLTLTASGRPPIPGQTSDVEFGCFVSVDVLLSEPGSGRLAVFPGDSTQPNLTAPILLGAAATWPEDSMTQVLAQAAFSVNDPSESANVALRGIECNTEVVILGSAVDLENNIIDSVVRTRATLPDAVPPAFEDGTPRLSSTSSTTASVVLQLDEPGEVIAQV